MEFDLSLVGFFHKVQERSKAYDEELKLNEPLLLIEYLVNNALLIN